MHKYFTALTLDIPSMPLLNAFQTSLPMPCPLRQKSNRKNKAGKSTTPMVSFLIFIAQIFYCNKMALTLDVSPCPFFMDYKPHSPCCALSGRNPTRQTKQANWPHPWWVFDFLLHKYVFVTKWYADPWCSAMHHIDALPTPLPMSCPLHSRNLTGKAKQANCPHPLWVFLFFIAQIFYCKNTALTIDVLPHPSSMNCKPYSPCSTFKNEAGQLTTQVVSFVKCYCSNILL
jgi:hypothetical protein